MKFSPHHFPTPEENRAKKPQVYETPKPLKNQGFRAMWCLQESNQGHKDFQCVINPAKSVFLGHFSTILGKSNTFPHLISAPNLLDQTLARMVFQGVLFMLPGKFEFSCSSEFAALLEQLADCN